VEFRTVFYTCMHSHNLLYLSRGKREILCKIIDLEVAVLDCWAIEILGAELFKWKRFLASVHPLAALWWFLYSHAVVNSLNLCTKQPPMGKVCCCCCCCCCFSLNSRARLLFKKKRELVRVVGISMAYTQNI
jgi:hypothetical protein